VEASTPPKPAPVFSLADARREQAIARGLRAEASSRDAHARNFLGWF
jgi:hypothetical protein